jgi:hypothetical protein
VAEQLTNATEADLLAELNSLLISQLIDALKGNPKASVMAVAEKVLSGRKSKKLPQPNLSHLHDLPFPRETRQPLGEPHCDVDARAGQLAKALETEFNTGDVTFPR